MSRVLPLMSALALGAGAGGLLGGCGSSTKTVSVSGSPPVSQTAGATGAHTGATSAGKPPRSGTSGEAATGATRTTSQPAFGRKPAGSEGLSAAVAVLRSKGFTPNDTSQFHSNQTLRVLVGTRSGSGDGYAQQAFFFLDGHYIGTDASQPSATLRVVSQSDTEVTLAYPLYRKADPLCCPGGGQATVHFQLNNGKLAALERIPPVNPSSGLGRE
jgi:LppP/LprE lipoprotein